MIILELELYKYKRFALSQIERLIYRPEHNLQIILGTNGCGKSSLLRELSPLSVSKADIEKPGYKKIVIEHHHKTYVLKSGYIEKDTPNKFRHSFNVDGVEYNKGNTLPEQKQLILEHFNYNEKLHDILTSQIRYSTMSVNDRKLWFDQLCGSNHDYAWLVYDQLKEQHRDIKGIIKHINQQLHEQYKKQIPKEQLDLYPVKIDRLNNLIQHINKCKRVLNHASLDKDIIYRQLLKLQGQITNQLNQDVDIDKLNQQLNHLNQSLIQIEVKMKEYNKYISQNKSKVEQYKLYLQQPSQQQNIYKKIDTLKQEIKHYDELRGDLKLTEDETKYFTKEYTPIKELLASIFNQLDQLGGVDQKQLDKDYENYKLVTAKIAFYEDKIKTYKQIIEEHDNYLQENDPISCPQCKHKFYNTRYTDKQINTFKDRVEEYQQQLNDYKKIVNELQSKLERYEERDKYLNQLRELYKLNKQHYKTLWCYLDLSLTSLNQPSSLINKLEQFDILLNYNKEYYAIQVELKDLLQQVKMLKALKDQQVQDILKEIEFKQDELIKLQKQKQQIKEQIELINRQIKQHNDLKHKLKDYKYHIKQYYQSYRTDLDKLYNSLIDHIQNTLHEELNKLYKEYNEYKTLHIQIDTLKKQLNELQEQQSMVSMMIEGLSPHTGLIAESLVNWINQYLEHMNKFIEQIWSYPLRLLPCEVDDEHKLTYRFPIQINDNKIIPDIKQGSNAMQEIVDLAYKLTFMLFRDLEDYPLYLDEFGSTMDQHHREQAYRIISGYISQQHHSQIFIVSHYEGIYGRFKNSDTIVLDKSNLDRHIKTSNVLEIR